MIISQAGVNWLSITKNAFMQGLKDLNKGKLLVLVSFQKILDIIKPEELKLLAESIPLS